MSAISDAIRWAEEIMKEIDTRWPVVMNVLASLVRTKNTSLVLDGLPYA